MKKAINFLILFILSIPTLKSQNLVPNPSFENTANIFCGIFSGPEFANSVNNWYTPTSGSPDLFSTQIAQSCWNYQPNSTYPGPICIKGTSMPRTGSTFAGILCYSIQGLNQREYIQAQLTSALVPGTHYCVDFFVSLADNTEKYIDNIGAFFSTTAVSGSSDQPLQFVPQVVSSTFIHDTSSWTLISGSFEATEAYNFITIGNFNDDNNTLTGYNPGGGIGPGCYGAYYFIDDISVSACIVGRNENNHQDLRLKIYPNPTNDIISVELSKPIAANIFIYDAMGRLMLRDRFKGATQIRTDHFSPGFYYYRITSLTGRTFQGKINMIRQAN